MKPYIRYFLYGILIFLSLLLWDAWQLEHQSKPNAADSVPTPATRSVPSNDAVPVSGLNHVNVRIRNITKHKPWAPKERLILVKTNVLDVKIDMQGGNVVQSDLLNYPQTLQNKQPTVLLSNDPNTLYVAQSGLFSLTDHEVLQYESAQTNYTCINQDKPLKIVLSAQTKNGLLIKKIYTFKPNDYQISLTFEIQNITGTSWSGSYFTQFVRNSQQAKQSHFLNAYSFFGVAISSAENPYQKIQLAKLSTDRVNLNIVNGWLAMIQHYFVGAWIPSQNVTYHYYSGRDGDGVCTLGMVSPEVVLKPGQSASFTSTLYVGPKITSVLEKVAPHLELTVDYGKLWIIAIVIFKLLKFVHRFMGNWGWSIVIVTCFIKLLFYKLSESSYRSMAAMRKLQPKIAKLKEQYGSDKQAMSRAMMELYKKEKINPLGGCLPILIQIPVFFALYVVLLESVELRQAPFIFWIHDLSAQDPYYILPVIMGISMYFQQKLTPTPTADEMQAKMMAFMPLFMTVLFLTFPSGLVLYWLVNNLLTIAQQWYILKKSERGGFEHQRSLFSRLFKSGQRKHYG